MRLVSFKTGGKVAIGVVVEDYVVPANALLSRRTPCLTT